ncbi:GPW/gp25 family protein [Hydrogenimonas thermophila]|uniref:GPW/gp25 family protein n=1 Tax=Hydrogenimonas thermophila TaxID=223786 RepID=UPI002936FE4B|nr:GPW/gp25 family protein [Hydrogenimonas thermophila]WOE69091.1 GPW/gp25 family protein [Hydrogenimonas thermophila]WOE71601.1 GPW/gp25 family protein [Hydrogenimonas thermophila]
MEKRISTEESIKRILETPLGSRVMRPEYGSRLFELIDKSVDEEWVLNAISYTYEAIEKNEPKVKVKKVEVLTGDVTSIKITYEENGVENDINLELTNVAA